MTERLGLTKQAEKEWIQAPLLCSFPRPHPGLQVRSLEPWCGQVALSFELEIPEDDGVDSSHDDDMSDEERSAAREVRAERWQEYTAAKEEQIRCKLEVLSFCGLPRSFLEKQHDTSVAGDHPEMDVDRCSRKAWTCDRKGWR